VDDPNEKPGAGFSVDGAVDDPNEKLGAESGAGFSLEGVVDDPNENPEADGPLGEGLAGTAAPNEKAVEGEVLGCLAPNEKENDFAGVASFFSLGSEGVSVDGLDSCFFSAGLGSAFGG
jgi:hypothetical protein